MEDGTHMDDYEYIDFTITKIDFSQLFLTASPAQYRTRPILFQAYTYP